MRSLVARRLLHAGDNVPNGGVLVEPAAKNAVVGHKRTHTDRYPSRPTYGARWRYRRFTAAWTTVPPAKVGDWWLHVRSRKLDAACLRCHGAVYQQGKASFEMDNGRFGQANTLRFA